MARELFIGEATVEKHLTHIHSGLEMKDRAGAVAAACRRGILR
ncbi:hypothetical protein [Streptomyces sp. NPDC059452]